MNGVFCLMDGKFTFSFTLKTRNCTATQLNFNKACQKYLNHHKKAFSESKHRYFNIFLELVHVVDGSRDIYIKQI